MGSSSTVRVPGKLMLAGEYSVLRPDGRALAMAVDVPLVVSAAPADQDRVTSAALGLFDAAPGSDPRLSFVSHALRVARAVAHIEPLQIDIQGHAGQVDGHGAKLGLGSSAAVTVGVVAAALGAADAPPPPEALFRLSALAHARAQGRAGSGYDVATQILGGVVAFRPAARERFELADEAIPAWLAADWPELAMERLLWPRGLHVAACWLGSGAKTSGMMDRTARARAADPPGYDACLDAMAAAAREVEQAFRTASEDRALAALSEAERALETWSDRFALSVVTDGVRRAVTIARAAGCEGRTSGAGGGDCVLAFADDPGALDAARGAWRDAGLVPVDVAIAEYGAFANGAAATGSGATKEMRT